MTEPGIEFARALADKSPAYFKVALSTMTKELAADFLIEELPLRTVQDLVVDFHDSAHAEYRRIRSGLIPSVAGRA